MTELQSFRSTALKLQSQKPSVLAPEVVASSPVKKAKDAVKPIATEKKALPTVVTIKPKKRSTSSSTESSKKLQPAKKKQTKAQTETTTAAATNIPTTSTGSAIAVAKSDAKPAAGALLLGYSSSSDSDA